MHSGEARRSQTAHKPAWGVLTTPIGRCQTMRCWMLQQRCPASAGDRRAGPWPGLAWLAWPGPTRFGAQSPAPRASLPRCAVRTENTPRSVIAAAATPAYQPRGTCFRHNVSSSARGAVRQLRGVAHFMSHQLFKDLTTDVDVVSFGEHAEPSAARPVRLATPHARSARPRRIIVVPFRSMKVHPALSLDGSSYVT